MNHDADPAALLSCRLRLGGELRRLRRGAGLSGAQVARGLYWSPSKLSRLEAGDNVTVDPTDVRVLCGTYRVDDETQALLADLATVTRTGADRWTAYAGSPDAAPGVVARLGLERSASVMQDYEAELVPRLLRTDAYARAIAARRVTQSQKNADWPPGTRYTAVLNESVLRRTVGAHLLDGWAQRGTAAVEPYAYAFTGLQAVAAAPGESLDMITRALKAH